MIANQQAMPGVVHVHCASAFPVGSVCVWALKATHRTCDSVGPEALCRSPDILSRQERPRCREAHPGHTACRFPVRAQRSARYRYARRFVPSNLWRLTEFFRLTKIIPDMNVPRIIPSAIPTCQRPLGANGRRPQNRKSGKVANQFRLLSVIRTRHHEKACDDWLCSDTHWNTITLKARPFRGGAPFRVASRHP